ncbi:MAG: MerR family transcriptional regulator [Trueperaceae bacterium]|nr:MerR family transcriptional regulator [Trueperaceae bacterium]
MQIGELARAARCSVATIRYYEQVGLLPAPERTAGNFRRYQATHLARLQAIRGCRALDLSRDEIRTLLAQLDGAARDCSAIDRVIDDHLTHVCEQIQALEHLRAQLEELRARCRGAGSVETCGVMAGLLDLDVEVRARVHT